MFIKKIVLFTLMIGASLSLHPSGTQNKPQWGLYAGIGVGALAMVGSFLCFDKARHSRPSKRDRDSDLSDQLSRLCHRLKNSGGEIDRHSKRKAELEGIKAKCERNEQIVHAFPFVVDPQKYNNELTRAEHPSSFATDSHPLMYADVVKQKCKELQEVDRLSSAGIAGLLEEYSSSMYEDHARTIGSFTRNARTYYEGAPQLENCNTAEDVKAKRMQLGSHSHPLAPALEFKESLLLYRTSMAKKKKCLDEELAHRQKLIEDESIWAHGTRYTDEVANITRSYNRQKRKTIALNTLGISMLAGTAIGLTLVFRKK